MPKKKTGKGLHGGQVSLLQLLGSEVGREIQPAGAHLGNPKKSMEKSGKKPEKKPGWWFEPLRKILVNWDDYSQYMGK